MIIIIVVKKYFCDKCGKEIGGNHKYFKQSFLNIDMDTLDKIKRWTVLILVGGTIIIGVLFFMYYQVVKHAREISLVVLIGLFVLGGLYLFYKICTKHFRPCPNI